MDGPIKDAINQLFRRQSGYTERNGVLHFAGVPVEHYDDGRSAEARKAHSAYLIDRYTNKSQVYCASCGGISSLGKMAVCRTCGDAYCTQCGQGRPIYRNPHYGTGFVCPSCRSDGRFGLAI